MRALDGMSLLPTLIGQHRMKMRTLKKLIQVMTLCVFTAVASSATTLLTGSIKNPDGTGFNGTLRLQISQETTIVSTGSCGGPVFVAPKNEVVITVSGGSLVSPPQLYGSDCTNPLNIPYIVRLIDNQGNTMFQDVWIISGTTIDVGTIVPVSTITNGQVFFVSTTFAPVLTNPNTNQTVLQPSGTGLTVKELGNNHQIFLNSTGFGQTDLGGFGGGLNAALYVDNNGVFHSATPGSSSSGTLCVVSTNGGPLAMSSCAGSISTSWSALSNPSGNLSLNMGNNKSTFTGSTATPSGFFTFQDTSGNSSSSALFAVTTNGNSTPAMSITTNGTNSGAVGLAVSVASTTASALTVTTPASNTSNGVVITANGSSSTGSALNIVTPNGEAAALFTMNSGSQQNTLTISNVGIVADAPAAGLRSYGMTSAGVFSGANPPVSMSYGSGSSGVTGIQGGQTTLFSGTSSGTNISGIDTIIFGGRQTGNSASGRTVIQAGALTSVSSVAAAPLINRTVISASKSGLSSGVATSLVSTAFDNSANPGTVGGTIIYNVEFNNGTDVCTASGIVHYAVVDKSATITSTVTPTEVVKCTGTATLSDAWSTTAASPTVLQITPTLTNLASPTTANWITYELFNNGQGQATIQ